MVRNGRIFALVAVAGLFAAVHGPGCSDDRAGPGSLGPWTGSGGGGGDASLPGTVLAGACADEGKTVACYQELGRAGDLVNCFSGTQTCTNGKWGPCGATTGTLSTVLAPPSGVQGGHLSIATTWGPDAGGCDLNPCNPYCVGTDVDAGQSGPDAGYTPPVVGVVQTITSFPPAKQNANAALCTPGSPPANLMLCSYDYCCSNTTQTCVQWIKKSDAVNCTVPTGVDYTVGIGCQDLSGRTQIPVCNRGTADSPTAGKLAVMGYPANPNQVGAASTPSVCQNSSSTPPEGCLIDLSVTQLKAGKCMNIDVQKAAAGLQPGVRCASAADFSTGNRTTQVNPPPTTTLPGAVLQTANGGVANYAQLAEVDKCNNFSFVYTQVGSCASYGDPPPSPLAPSFTYTATCAPGTKPQWNLFAYSTTVPNASNVKFEVSTAPLLTDGGTGTFTTPVLLAHPATPLISDPAVCPMTGGVTGCPKNLYTILGGIPAAHNPVLKLDVTLTTVTGIPLVNAWQLSYSCVPME